MLKRARNPVPVILLLGLLCGSCGKEKGVDDLVTVKGTASIAVAETYLFAYREDMDLHGPAAATAGPTGPDGGYQMRLPPGRYIFVARKRKEGETSGPVQSGDWRSKPYGPVEIKAGEPVNLALLLELKEGETKSLPAQQSAETKTGINGRILDEDGKPVPKARVHVYQYVQMSERPKFVSNETGPDGTYVVYLPEGGTYYLAARNRFGGPPKLGDLYGRYDDGTVDPSGVVVKDGEILRNVDITVHKVW